MAGRQTVRGWSSWVTGTTVVGSIGVCAGTLLWGPSRLVALGVPVALVVAVAHFLSRGDHAGRARGPMLWRSIVRVSMCATALLMSLSLIAALSSALCLLALLGLGSTTPPVRKHLQRLGVAQPPEPQARLRSLSDAELCHEWRRSSHHLTRTRDVTRRLELVITRQHLLDEAWTRNRDELEAWVACGARARDGTHRFFDAQ